MGLSFYIITHFITGLVAIVFGLSVFLKNRKKSVNRVFGLLTLSVAIWSLSYSIWLLSKDPEFALFWSRTLNLGATLIPVFYLHWIFELFKKRKRKILLFYYFITAIFVLFSYSNYYISGTREILQFPYWPQMNWLYFLFLVVCWITIIFYSLGLLFKRFNNTRGYQREQIKYVLLGSIIGFLGGSTNYPLMMGIDWFPPFGSPLVIAYPIIFGYAMIRHRLMDIRFVLRKYSVYMVSLVSIILPAIVIKYIVNNYYALTEIWIDFAILIVGISVFPTIKNYYYRVANKYFFSSLYDAREVITGLSDKLKSTLEINKIYQYISDALINSFHAKTVSILLFNEKKRQYEVQFDFGHKPGEQISFTEDKGFYSKVILKNPVIVIEELKEQVYKKFKKTIDLLIAYEVEILIPLNLEDKIIGLLALGSKESGDMYNDEDLEVLGIIGSQVAMAVENALIYEENRNFGIKLEKEVKKATAELRKANEKLKQLDAAKSEFISIASHQLRTPLTVIKGYISMMLEGNFGKLTTNEVDSLEKVYESNERLIQLVENLLNVSRIESGRLLFNYEVMQLEDLVSDVIEELSNNAKKKGLRLNYKLSEELLPALKIDEEKIRQVVMNLIDNAIKYTKKGSITVSLKKEDNNIQFCVADSGIGVSKEDLPNLFKKFSRGSGTSLIHTEGTGLGLYVAWEMIEAHGGKIWAESKGESKGSKFCFILPIYTKK
jgi:signal transduction histidine kinase